MVPPSTPMSLRLPNNRGGAAPPAPSGASPFSDCQSMDSSRPAKDAPPTWNRPYTAPPAAKPKLGVSAAAAAALKAHDERAELKATDTARTHKEKPE
eukprot:424972-Prymnesium_polylepis.1